MVTNGRLSLAQKQLSGRKLEECNDICIGVGFVIAILNCVGGMGLGCVGTNYSHQMGGTLNISGGRAYSGGTPVGFHSA